MNSINQSKHRWTYEENRICCEVFIENYVLNNKFIAKDECVSIAFLKLGGIIAKPSILMKMENIKQICIELKIRDRSDFAPLQNYSTVNLKAMMDVLNENKNK